MFRALAKILVSSSSSTAPVSQPFGADNVFRLHPGDIVGLLELAWDHRQLRGELGRPFRRNALTAFEDTFVGRPVLSANAPAETASGADGRPRPPNIQTLLNVLRLGSFVLSDHLIYAYMIENTRIKPIMQRVVFEFMHGEKLGTPSVDTQHWLRTTEQLFFRDPPPLFVTSVQSDVRPDSEATRRNAYQRMFGMDLNHGGADNKPYPYVRADAANKEFVSTFEELLREVWVGIINATNTSGTRATDDAKLRDLIKKLEEMLNARRINGNLSREEFAFVSMMAWFHLTLETDTPVVIDIKAQATNAEQRLYRIAQLVGLPAHGLSGSYFDIADSISRVLLLIESGFFKEFPDAIAGLYTPGTGTLETAMRTIITHWSIITGRDLKAGKVAPLESPRRPSPVGA